MFSWPWTTKAKTKRLVAKADKTVIHLKAAKTKLDKALDELEGMLNDDRKATSSSDNGS